jgi:putative methyltransferase (TIGR04325 family)
MECSGADTFCRGKEKHFQDKYLRFFETIDDFVKDIKPNAILLSSVLQYLSDPGKIIDTLIKIGSDVILIDRTIVNSNNVNNIFIQHVPPTIYHAIRFLNLGC